MRKKVASEQRYHQADRELLERSSRNFRGNLASSSEDCPCHRRIPNETPGGQRQRQRPGGSTDRTSGMGELAMRFRRRTPTGWSAPTRSAGGCRASTTAAMIARKTKVPAPPHQPSPPPVGSGPEQQVEQAGSSPTARQSEDHDPAPTSGTSGVGALLSVQQPRSSETPTGRRVRQGGRRRTARRGSPQGSAGCPGAGVGTCSSDPSCPGAR